MPIFGNPKVGESLSGTNIGDGLGGPADEMKLACGQVAAVRPI